MKKTDIFFLAIGGLLLCLSPLIFSEDKTNVNLIIKGDVVGNCEILINPTSKASSLNITTGESDSYIAKVTETCNSPNGYAVNFESQNVGHLNSLNGSGKIRYTLKYDNNNIQTNDFANNKITVTRDEPQFSREVEMLITLPSSPNIAAGSYEDVLSLTIEAK